MLGQIRQRGAPVERQDRDVEGRERNTGKEEEAGEEGEGSCGGHRRQGSPELRELMLLIAGGEARLAARDGGVREEVRCGQRAAAWSEGVGEAGGLGWS